MPRDVSSAMERISSARVLLASPNIGEVLCRRTPTTKRLSITRTPRKAIAWLLSITEKGSMRRGASTHLKLGPIPKQHMNIPMLRTVRAHRRSRSCGMGPRSRPHVAAWAIDLDGLEPAHCLVIATNHRRTIASAISDAAIIRITSNCNSNDPDITASAQNGPLLLG